MQNIGMLRCRAPADGCLDTAQPSLLHAMLPCHSHAHSGHALGGLTGRLGLVRNDTADKVR